MTWLNVNKYAFSPRSGVAYSIWLAWKSCWTFEAHLKCHFFYEGFSIFSLAKKKFLFSQICFQIVTEGLTFNLCLFPANILNKRIWSCVAYDWVLPSWEFSVWKKEQIWLLGMHSVSVLTRLMLALMLATVADRSVNMKSCKKKSCKKGKDVYSGSCNIPNKIFLGGMWFVWMCECSDSRSHNYLVTALSHYNLFWLIEEEKDWKETIPAFKMLGLGPGGTVAQ